MLRETRDNIVASFVDMGSIFVAYRIGLSQLGFFAGLAYGILDAWIVVWQRDRISDGVHRILNFVRNQIGWRRRDSLPWVAD